MHDIPSKDDILLASLTVYYKSNPSHLKIFTEVLQGSVCSTPISLRALDWLVTNYAKKKNSAYALPDGTWFNIYMEYKAQLRSYSKRLFDPFNRGDSILFNDPEGNEFTTTPCQLNFFRWAITRGVLDYCIIHAVDIEEDMMRVLADRKLVNEKKRKELSRAAVRGVTCTGMPKKVIVTFC